MALKQVDCEQSEESEESENESGPLPLPSVAEAKNGATQIRRQWEADKNDKNLHRKKKRRRDSDEFEALYLARLPSGELYEKSYMHKAEVSHTAVCTKSGFLLTASRDGQVRFWKIVPKGIRFVKTFQAHSTPITCLSKSIGEKMVCSSSSDKELKIFDVGGFHIMTMLQLDFVPSIVAWMLSPKFTGDRSANFFSNLSQWVAVAEKNTGNVAFFDIEFGDTRDDGTAVPVARLLLSQHELSTMAYNVQHNCIISTDCKGFIEYWTIAPENEGDKSDVLVPASSSNASVKFHFKLETDLFEMAKKNTYAVGISISPNGEKFVVSTVIGLHLLYDFCGGKLLHTFDESLSSVEKMVSEGKEVCKGIDSMDLGKRIAVERKYRKALEDGVASPSIAIFDDTSKLLLVPSLVGIKIASIATKEVLHVLGRLESTERFVSLCIYQGKPENDHQISHASNAYDTESTLNTGSAADTNQTDDRNVLVIEPLVFCASFQRERFYIFSTREPSVTDSADVSVQHRDVFNEKPTSDLKNGCAAYAGPSKVLARQATIHTGFGDIVLQLYPDVAPLAVENFATHSGNGYYDGVCFHRVIKGFMIQTGDPLGNGTGGESIWGGTFRDEVDTKKLKLDRPFTVAMANSGPGTNGSQFFITTQATPWLDGKHTVFGRVVHGIDIVSQIERVDVDKTDKPLKSVHILSIDTSVASPRIT